MHHPTARAWFPIHDICGKKNKSCFFVPFTWSFPNQKRGKLDSGPLNQSSKPKPVRAELRLGEKRKGGEWGAGGIRMLPIATEENI